MELWTYYKVTLGRDGGAFLLRLTGESGGHIFGVEVDDQGQSLRRTDGTLRFHVLDRRAVSEIMPLTLLAGRLIAAEKPRREETKPEKPADGNKPLQPPA
jgi:hypothetical protein